MNPRPIDIGIILIPGPPDQIEIPTQHHRVLIRADLPNQLIQKLLSTLMICRSIDQHKPPLLIGSSLKKMGTKVEGALPPNPNLKSLIPETQQ
jgi:hypothetical protein